MKSRNKKKTRKTGFKKLTLKLPRAKIKKRHGCGDVKDPNFVPANTQKRRAGRMIKRMKRMAEQGAAA